MSKILLLGDSHGNLDDIEKIQEQSLKKMPDVKLAIQVGDFGFYQLAFNKWMSHRNLIGKKDNYKLPMKTFVIDGNHEDHEWLHSLDKKELEEKFNIFFKPRGSIEIIDGATICFLGGAVNVDRNQFGSIDKRTTNYPLRIEVAEALEKFNPLENIDLMVTHSCPHSIGIGMAGAPIFNESIEKFCHKKGHSTGDINDCGEGALRRLWYGLEKKPSNWVYGHFHTKHFTKIENTFFYCIGCSDSSDGKKFINPFYFDTEKKDIEYLNNITLMNYDGFHSTTIL